MATFHEPRRGYPGCFYAPSMNADQPAGEINTACTICKFPYYDESGCDPCPKCGASYGSQIWHEEGREMKTIIFCLLLAHWPASPNRTVHTRLHVHCGGNHRLITTVTIREDRLYAYASRDVPRHALQNFDKWTAYNERCGEVEARRLERFFGLPHTEPGYFAR